jgi:N-acetylglucosamine kinase-like BadF-type ATPase
MSELGEIRAALAGVAEQIGSAYEQAGLARARIADAVALLSGLGEQHSEPLVPDELRRAVDELERGLGLISTGAAVVADIDARL